MNVGVWPIATLLCAVAVGGHATSAARRADYRSVFRRFECRSAQCACAIAPYGLYLTHVPVMRFLGKTARLTGLDFAASPFLMAGFFVVSVAFAICVALLVFKVVEEPVLEAFKRLLRRPVPVPAS